MEKRINKIFSTSSIDSDGLHVDGDSKKIPSGVLSGGDIDLHIKKRLKQ